MAFENVGISFSPLATGRQSGHRPGSGNQTQEAIRTISTRIPRITPGARAIAPEPLLSAGSRS